MAHMNPIGMSGDALIMLQEVVVSVTGLPRRVIDWNFHKLSLEERRKRARNRQRRIKTNPRGPKVCADCGDTENLQRHHLVSVMLGGRNVKENLVWLCKKCHDKRHGRR